MKTKNAMDKIKLIASLSFFFVISVIYSQEGFNVDKDYRIKKYQKDMIKFLIDDNQFGTEEIKGAILIKNYSGSMGITKCIEVFPVEPKENKILLVRFFSFGTGAESYWGILEKDSKYLFYYNEKDISKIKNYLKKYDTKTQQILLDYVKIYTEWNGPNTHSPQVIDVDLKK
jgi:hypothetical protein